MAATQFKPVSYPGSPTREWRAKSGARSFELRVTSGNLEALWLDDSPLAPNTSAHHDVSTSISICSVSARSETYTNTLSMCLLSTIIKDHPLKHILLPDTQRMKYGNHTCVIFSSTFWTTSVESSTFLKNVPYFSSLLKTKRQWDSHSSCDVLCPVTFLSVRERFEGFVKNNNSFPFRWSWRACFPVPCPK